VKDAAAFVSESDQPPNQTPFYVAITARA
jgi:hypothetical protein